MLNGIFSNKTIILKLNYRNRVNHFRKKYGYKNTENHIQWTLYFQCILRIRLIQRRRSGGRYEVLGMNKSFSIQSKYYCFTFM